MELLECLESGTRLEEVKGIVFLDGENREVVTPSRAPIEDLNALPCPSAGLLIRPKTQRNLAVISARGCPYRCTFCFEGGNTKQLRVRSVDNVMSEIWLRLDESPDVNYLWFADDTFTLDHDRTASFCTQLGELRKQRDFVWFCEGHARVLSKHPELIHLMVDSGMARIKSAWKPAGNLAWTSTTRKHRSRKLKK